MTEEIIFSDITKNIELYSDGTTNISREKHLALEQENAELKAENARLKEEIKRLDEDAFCYEVSEIEYQRIKRYKQTLQEIDEIISRTDSQHPPSVANMVSSIRHKLYELTKAESEG